VTAAGRLKAGVRTAGAGRWELVGCVRHLDPDVAAIVAALEAAAAGDKQTITRAAALAAGLSISAIKRLCASGRWVRLAEGVYAVAGRDGGPFQQTYAELVPLRPRGFAQCLNAAAILGSLDLEWDGVVDIAVEAGGSNRRTRRRVPTAHIIEVDGTRCADGLLTLLDLASVVDATRWEWALEAALRGSTPLTTIATIEAALAAPATRRDLAAVDLVESVLARRPPGAPATGSKLETQFVQLARRYGLPTPVRQHCVEISPTTRYFVDFAWPERRFFIEVDGSQHDVQALHDADRIASIVLATGWNHVVLRHHQIVRTPRYTADRITRLLSRDALAS
jgi:very-short-patch-repair endonuclease